jgi:ADP-dependent NAD(P)H-hydrate dehydratase / NAD(P)H-hydrate epimerase
LLEDAELAVDALFGVGFTRPAEGTAASVIDEINRGAVPCVAVDVPSGISGSNSVE